jgi:hypothetical protein
MFMPCMSSSMFSLYFISLQFLVNEKLVANLRNHMFHQIKYCASSCWVWVCARQFLYASLPDELSFARLRLCWWSWKLELLASLLNHHPLDMQKLWNKPFQLSKPLTEMTHGLRNANTIVWQEKAKKEPRHTTKSFVYCVNQWKRKEHLRTTGMAWETSGRLKVSLS